MTDRKPPCECIEQVNGRWTYRCECSNGGDAEGAATWVADENNRDTITTLRAENERLRAALKPFADMGKAMMGRKHHNEAVVQYALAPTIFVHHLVSAHEVRAALEEKQ